MTTLVIAEHNNKGLLEGMAQTITAAQQLGHPIHIVVAGLNCQVAAQHAAHFQHVEKVWLVQHDTLAHGLAEPLADLITFLAKDYAHIVAPASRFGKNILPRVAGLLDVMQISDVLRIVSPTVFERPIYAGNILQTIETRDALKLLTIRTTEFEPIAMGENPAPIEELTWTVPNTLSQFIEKIQTVQKSVDLSLAKNVVVFGRALATKENVETFIAPLAAALHAGIGATRAAVDAGLAPNDWQIGQSGRIIAPELYIGVGLSGALQHIAGIKGAHTIVAINQDDSAPITQFADFALVGDLFTILPELTEGIKKRKI